MSDAPANAAAPVVAPVATPQTPSEPGLDTRLAALSRKEREVQQQIAAFKQEKAGMVSKADLANLWKSDRSKLREYVGASPEEWNIPEPTAPAPIDPVAALKQELEEMKASASEKERSAQEAEFKKGITDFVTAGSADYELIAAYSATESVFDFMVDYYREHTVELSLKEACDYVENYLLTELKKATSTKKIGSLFQPSQEPGKQPAPTLTGAATANPAGSATRRLSPEESLAQAAKLIKWN